MEKTASFEMEKLCLALSDRTRLRLLNLMGEDEVCVCFFVEALNEPQPKISRHLAFLRQAGIVSARRDGKWMHYRIAQPSDPHARKMLAEVLAWMGKEQQMQADRARLLKVCCAPTPPVQLRGAPKPVSVKAG
jgi:ArsR family transcriptional regulator